MGGCDYLSMLGLKLNHVSKRGHRSASPPDHDHCVWTPFYFMYETKCFTTFPWCTINAPVAFAWCTINFPVAFAWCTNHFVHKVEFSYIGWNGVHPLWRWGYNRPDAPIVSNTIFALNFTSIFPKELTLFYHVQPATLAVIYQNLFVVLKCYTENESRYLSCTKPCFVLLFETLVKHLYYKLMFVN